MDQGSQIDLRGGGNETANQWISGLGGTINLLGTTTAWGAGVSYAAGTLVSYKGSIWSARQANSTVPSVGLDWTQIPQYYAIIPGYDANFAPTGYADGSLAVGSRVTIAGGGGLPAGTYTLLPASYATQSGAYLISAASISSPLAGSFTQPDGSVIISGTTFNGLDSAVTAPRTTTLFTLLSPSAIANRVDYNVLSAGTFFSSLGASSQPDNAGKLLFQAITSMVLDGNVSGGGGTGGTGASIDISEPGAIDITQNGSGGKNGALVLGADQLSSWSFGSLLLGGIRGTPVNGLTPVTVTATSITLEGGATLSGNDIILAASDGINIDRGSTITASGSSLAPDEQISVSGDGVLIRVSSDQQAGTTRSGSDTTAIAGITLASGATLSGASLTLDSSENLSIDPNALLDSGTLNLDAGKIAINFNGSIESGALNLSGKVLDNLDAVNKLNLTSYSSIDFNGSGVLGSSGLAFLGIHAGEIQGDNSSFDAITAGTILLDDANGSPDPSGGSPSATGGSLSITGSILNLGSGALSIAGFQSTVASLSGGIEGISTKVSSSGVNVAGTLTDGGNLTFNTPIVTGGASSVTTIQSAGSLITAASGSSVLSPGLGASLRLRGRSVDVAAPTELPSGSVSIESTGGELTVASSINVAGVSKSYFNVTKYTDGGAITLSSDTGNIDLAGGSVLNLNAPSLAGSAGTLAVNAPQGTVIFNGSLEATAPQGQAGKLTADFNSYDGGNLATLESTLTASGFTQSQTIRLRSGDVTVSNVKAHAYTLTADAGSITVAGTINAAGQTGGSVALEASGSVILNAGSLLTVQAQAYNAAGKGGSILLSAGAEIDGKIDSSATLDLQSGSTIDLGVTAAATSTQDFGGVLHLRTPEAALQNITLASAIGGASAIEVEGYQLYQVSGGGGIITTSLRNAIASDIANFYGSAGANSSGASSILASLDANLSTENQRILNLAPGVEIINETGGLTLGSDWDLSTLRAGANSTPGFLTLRASGSITFNASLSDGFQSSAYNADLLSQNSALSANFQSWAYQITAGADLSAAIANAVVAGSDANVALGIVYNNGGQNVAPNAGLNASTAAALAGYYQVIRTGTGDISIASSGDLQLWNQFASIYTAGVQVSDPTMGGTFDVPQPSFNNQTGSSVLGVAQQTPPYAPQYSYAGGNINVDVGGNITQLTKDINKNIIGDSVSELPSNWLYRRGALAADGTFLHTTLPNSEILSTTWWVDFSNFFDDFGALGGGNITLNADQNISNINASIPTNYRMPGHAAGSSVSIAPDPANGVELGGGNLAVNAGNNIDAGVYYVEKGNGSLMAGGSIITNPTRDPNHPASLRPTADISASYLPTTLFLGKGNFDVQAAGDVLLGPVANVFLTPQGVNNSYWYKDYFSTYAASDQVDVESLGGNISFREEAVSSSTGTPESLLELWMQGFTIKSNANIAYSQPWLRLDEQTIEASLASLFALEPPTLNATALVGDITFQGNYTTLPSPTGNITLIAGGGINGLTDSGLNAGIHYWISSRINLSDADPSSIPGITDPDSQQTSTSVLQNASRVTAINYNIHSLDFTGSIAALFDESGFYTGGTYGVLQTKEQLHGTSLLHANDSVPLQFYAQSGDISGLTLFSAKQSEISAGGNIADVGIYIQNNSVSDVSIVTAGGSIIAYDPSTPFQQLAQAAYTTTDTTPSFSYTQTGDIQISGPGTLEVLAGGNLDLGNAPNYTDDNTEVAGAGVGITSIGNSRNPNLPFAGADIIAEAGVKLPTGLSSTGGLAMASFVNTVLLGAEGATYLSELSDAMTYSGDPLSGTITAASFASGSTQLSSEEKAKLELQLFYIVLRDTGRNHNKLGSPGYGSYATGNKAIQNFFASTPGSGNIITWGQRIETVNGGNIDLLAPGGALTLANFTTSDSLTPPGIITEGGGGINIYTKGDVSIGLGRIFTLRGGDIMIWSNDGNIAAGSSSKTVQSAPPTQVLIDPQSGDVETDLAGLATGGGIGVLETVADVPPGNVDLIAPSGVIDAGDAGIRSSGNLNLAATKILNANNIAASGTTSGAPPTPPPPAAPNISGATSASAAAAANNSAAQNAATNNSSSTMTEEAPSIISVEVLGYGGGDDDSSSPSGPTTSTGSKAPPQASL